jgi:chorismate-pyruvate lyase
MQTSPPRQTQRRVFTRATALRCVLLFAALAAAGCSTVPASRDDRYLERVELLALLQTLNADLLSHDSATLTLERWCGDHRLAEPPRIVARRVRDVSKPVPDDLRALLKVGAEEPVGYRHVQLMCGAHVFSEADNWYVPGRLTADMNQRLNTTDEPFGKVVQALHFQRRTLSADLLWSPLPAGWEMRGTQAAAAADRSPLRIPGTVLRHRAVLIDAAQQPFSTVVETYTNQLFEFGPWQSD